MVAILLRVVVSSFRGTHNGVTKMNSPFIGRYKSDEGVRTGVVREANKYIYWLPVDYPVRVHRIAASEAKYITRITYPVKKIKTILRRMAKVSGIPIAKNAKAMLEAL